MLGRAAAPQGAIADLGYLQFGIDLGMNAFQITAGFKLVDEIT